MANDDNKHFVYVYRDERGNPVYFGQGKAITRAAARHPGARNEVFERWLNSPGRKSSVEVIGPLHSKKMANAIETALISACKPAKALGTAFFNQHPGTSEYRFRTLGVPDKYAQRTVEALTERELKELCRRVGPVMFVRINDQNFESSDRPGYDLAAPPSDPDIRARVEAWWQVANRVPDWSDKPQSSPALLVGVTGGPGSQFIIAAFFVDREHWSEAEKSPAHGLLKIPLKFKTLDAEDLRGRPLPAEIGLRFNAFRHSQFRIYTKKGLEASTRLGK